VSQSGQNARLSLEVLGRCVTDVLVCGRDGRPKNPHRANVIQAPFSYGNDKRRLTVTEPSLELIAMVQSLFNGLLEPVQDPVFEKGTHDRSASEAEIPDPV